MNTSTQTPVTSFDPFGERILSPQATHVVEPARLATLIGAIAFWSLAIFFVGSRVYLAQVPNVPQAASHGPASAVAVQQAMAR